jgi:hypothetical protein
MIGLGREMKFRLSMQLPGMWHRVFLNNYPSLEQHFNWSPLAYSEETECYFEQELEKEGWPIRAIPPELVMGTVLRFTRHLAF